MSRHPDWCARGHRCATQLAEHRSDPWTIRTRYGAIIATRVRCGDRERLELRTVIELPADQGRARRVAELAMLGVDRAIRRITTRPQ